MIHFSNWLAQRESTARTRAIAAFTKGTQVYPGGNVHSHNTASPATVAKFEKKFGGKRKKKRKFGSTKNRKKVSHVNRNVGVDKWIKESDKLKDALLQLKAIFDKKKEIAKKEPDKSDKEKDKDQKKPLDSKEKTDKEVDNKDHDDDELETLNGKEDEDKDKEDKPKPGTKKPTPVKAPEKKPSVVKGKRV